MNENLHISQKGINELIKPREGLKLYPYNDAGKDSIYYGHQILPGETFLNTQAEADLILQRDIVKAENIVKSRITVPLNQNQFDALVSLVYNIPYAVYDGTIDDKINSGATETEIRTTWQSYNKIKQGDGYITSEWLTKFRKKETDFFFSAPLISYFTDFTGNATRTILIWFGMAAIIAGIIYLFKKYWKRKK